MIWALLITAAIALLGGSTMEEGFMIPDLEKEIKHNVQDEERKQQVLELVSDTKKELKVFNKQYGKYQKKAKKISGDRNTPISEIDALHTNATKKRKALQESLVDKRIAIQELLTDDEWDKILKNAMSTGDKSDHKEAKAEAKLEESKEKVFGGIKKVISKEIENPEKREKVIASFKSFEVALFDLLDALIKSNYASNEDLSKRTASKTELMAFYDEQNEAREKIYPSYIELIKTLKENTSDDEWKTIYKQLDDLF